MRRLLFGSRFQVAAFAALLASPLAVPRRALGQSSAAPGGAGASSTAPVNGSAVTPSASAPASSAAAGPSPAQIEEARRYFEQGESLRAAEKWQAALEAYLKSRSLIPRASNTLNAAVCLFHLDRLDEAYDLFEEALSKYPEGSLTPAARESAKGTMATIESKVGRVDVSANVDGVLVIDGRARGKLPIVTAVRVMPGRHVVRVLRDGFSTYEKTVEVRLGETTSVDAKLEPLASAGRLHVGAEADLEGAELIVDGAAVGTLPWEGTLAPGTHVCMVAKGDVGAGPMLANVIVGQTVQLAVKPQPLGPERRVVVEPASADLSIDGVAVGKGRFQARLPLGAHVVEAREPGYVSARRSFEVTSGDGSDWVVKLEVDPTHPRWKSSKLAGRFGVEVFGGYGFASSLGTDTAWCTAPNQTSCAGTTSPSGLRVGALAIYELDGGLGFFLGAGWLTLKRGFHREYDHSFGSAGTVHYAFDDDLQINGPFASAGVGYRLKLGKVFDLSARVLLSGAFPGVRDYVTGTGSSNGRTLPTLTQNSGVIYRGLMLEAVPELAAGVTFGRLRVSLGMAARVSLIDGPIVDLGPSWVDPAKKDPKTGNAVDVAGNVGDFTGAKGFSRFVELVPQAGVTYWF